MTSYRRATATQIWHQEGRERTGLTAFLWEDVASVAAERYRVYEEDGTLREWQDEHPKTLITFTDSTALVVLGKVEKWLLKWDTYLVAGEQHSMILTRN